MKNNRFGIVGLGALGRCFSHLIVKEEGMHLAGFLRPVNKEKVDFLHKDLLCSSYEELIECSDVILLAVPDDHIGEVVAIIDSNGLDLNNKVFVHFSGVRSSEVFAGLIEKGSYGFSLHPLMAFTGDISDLDKIHKAFITVEEHSANPYSFTEENQLMPEGFRSLISLFGERVQWIEPDYKALYHGGAVTVSNYLVTVVEEGFSYLRKAGFDEGTIQRMLMPLVEGTVSNIRAKGRVQGLTGPILRGDTGTIAAHQKAIEKHMGSESGDLYRQLGIKTANMIKGQRIDERTYESLIHTLEQQ